jgi:hypothetical protein
MKITTHPINLEECLKKVKIKRINGDEWLFTDKACENCSYNGEVIIHYCRSRQVYLKQYINKNQLELPFPRE